LQVSHDDSEQNTNTVIWIHKYHNMRKFTHY